MKLLFDENISRHLVRLLAVLYPDSQHVDLVALNGQPNLALWEYAARHGFTLVSKDNDFRQLSFLRGQPPKVIWLRRHPVAGRRRIQPVAATWPRAA